MKKIMIILLILCAVVLAGASIFWFLGADFFSQSPINTNRPFTDFPTLTVLPDFPEIPADAASWDQEKIDDLMRKVVDHKLSTYPEKISGFKRAGKFATGGIFGAFDPTEEQARRLAPYYDLFIPLVAKKKNLIPLFKKYNPKMKFFLYVDSGLNPDFADADAGSVDAENTEWILKNHPDWILKDKDGNFVRSGGGLSNEGEYWPDPGNKEWQDYFAGKITKLVQKSGGQWDGVLLDQFLVTADAHERYAAGSRQAKYADDASYQDALIQFLENVSGKISIPVMPNIEGAVIPTAPDFFRRAVIASGGAEIETFPYEMPMEDLKTFLSIVKNLPKNKFIRVSSNADPVGWAGDTDKTLFAYYTYLLFADPSRNVYWSYKEGTSDIPHYWFKEFDLNLGAPLEDYQEVDRGNSDDVRLGGILKRDFENAVVVVNANHLQGKEFYFDGTMYNILGKEISSPFFMPARSAALFFKDQASLTKAISTIK